MRESLLSAKSFEYALRVIKLSSFLRKEKGEYMLGKQILRSGTSVGANIREGYYAQSDADFISKMSIARNEAAETEYWLELSWASDYITKIQFESLFADCEELMKLLTSTIKTMKSKNGKLTQ